MFNKTYQTNMQVGATQEFVIARGLIQVGHIWALIASDGSRRVFAELFADPDRPEVRPAEAYSAILSSINPGWTLRILQLFWPDPAPRLAFFEQAQSWGKPAAEGLDILREGLLLTVRNYPLPFTRRTVVEFALPGDDGLAWWDALEPLCAVSGVRVTYLGVDEITSLARWVMNPALEHYSQDHNTDARQPSPDA